MAYISDVDQVRRYYNDTVFPRCARNIIMFIMVVTCYWISNCMSPRACLMPDISTYQKAMHDDVFLPSSLDRPRSSRPTHARRWYGIPKMCQKHHHGRHGRHLLLDIKLHEPKGLFDAWYKHIPKSHAWWCVSPFIIGSAGVITVGRTSRRLWDSVRYT